MHYIYKWTELPEGIITPRVDPTFEALLNVSIIYISTAPTGARITVSDRLTQRRVNQLYTAIIYQISDCLALRDARCPAHFPRRLDT
jgi:hypothetical protein